MLEGRRGVANGTSHGVASGVWGHALSENFEI